MIGYALAFPLDEVVRLVIILENAESALRQTGEYDFLSDQVQEKAEQIDGKIAQLQAALRESSPRS